MLVNAKEKGRPKPPPKIKALSDHFSTTPNPLLKHRSAHLIIQALVESLADRPLE
jgi:hypothetical protein